jgi:hypothetical protein
MTMDPEQILPQLTAVLGGILVLVGPAVLTVLLHRVQASPHQHLFKTLNFVYQLSEILKQNVLHVFLSLKLLSPVRFSAFLRRIKTFFVYVL